NNIMDNAKWRKTDTKRDAVIQSLYDCFEKIDFTIQTISDFTSDFSECIQELKKLSRNSSSAVEIQALQKELSFYATLYNAPEQEKAPEQSATITMSCGS